MGRTFLQHAGLTLLLATLTACAAPAWATTIDLSWDVCSPIIVNKTTNPNVAIIFLWVSVTGHSQPHKGYEFWMSVGDESNAVPDAWRFDVGGCQGPSFITIDHLTTGLAKTCPSFQGALQSLQIKSYQPAPAHLNLPPGMAVIVLANAYPSGNFSQVIPASRYYLGRILFDHTFSVPGAASEPGTCGGLEHGMCFRLIPSRCNWANEAGAEIPFTIGNGLATVNGGCLAVPAANVTWGQIKGQYRR